MMNVFAHMIFLYESIPSIYDEVKVLNPNDLSLKKVSKYLALWDFCCHILNLKSGSKIRAIISVMQCILVYLALNVVYKTKEFSRVEIKAESTYCRTTKLVTMVKERAPRCDQITEAINAVTLLPVNPLSCTKNLPLPLQFYLYRKDGIILCTLNCNTGLKDLPSLFVDIWDRITG